MTANSPHNWSDLLSKYLQGTITKSELLELQRQMELCLDKKRQFERFSNPDYMKQRLDEMLDYDITNIRNKVMAGLPAPQSAKVVSLFTITTLKIVAGLILLATSIAVLLYVRNKFFVYDNKTLVHHSTNKPVITAQTGKDSAADIYPGSYKAIFTLFDGKTFHLEKKRNGLVTKVNDQPITTKDGTLVFKTRKPAQKADSKFNKLQTPKGGEYTMQLPDGSKVRLNAASTIRFPSFFSGNKRIVEVEGEAYFEVITNPKMPFYVKLQNGYTIKVTGTKFNVNSHRDDGITKITLIKGAIQVGFQDSIPSYQYLKQDQQMQILPDGSTKIIEAVNVDEVVSWKDEMFNFNNTDLKSIMKQIERWYDVELHFDEAAPNPALLGAISRNRPLNEVLKFLREGSGVDIYVKGRTIHVAKKSN